MRDFNHIKKILLKEYETIGKRNEMELVAFLEGMTYLQDYIESNQEEIPLNEYVPEEAVIAVLKRQLEEKEKTIKELKIKIKDKNQALNNYRSMTKDERRELRKEEAYRNLEKKYSCTRTELIIEKNLRYSENP